MSSNHLRKIFYESPATARQTMTTKDYRETLLVTNQRITVNKETWEIVGKNLGAGVWEVTLKVV